jgi:hypothetical protein
LKYINSPLKEEFGLEDTSKPKPVYGPDDLLLMLVHHWARNKSVLPTEDNRVDTATIMLFQAYTGGRPAEFVDVSKGKASQDPLGIAETFDNNERQKAEYRNYGDNSNASNDVKYNSEDEDLLGNGVEYNSNDEDLFDDRVEYNSDDDDLFDDDQKSLDGDSNGNAIDTNSGGSMDADSGYNSDETDIIMTEKTDTRFATKVNKFVERIEQDCDTADLDEFGEAKRKYKALCYEDICLWIVQNPVQGGRDVLAMEVHLRHHKGVDNKPKPYVALIGVLRLI